MPRGKMASEIPKIVLCFSVLAHNSTPLWLLEFCLSISVVSCSCLSEDSAEFRDVSLYMKKIDSFFLCCKFEFRLNCTEVTRDVH